MILPKHALIEGKVVSNLISDSQFQPAGVDLTLKDAFVFESAGSIDFDNSERKLSEVKKLEFDAKGWLHLAKGAYKIVYNEAVKIPSDCIALAFPRSSLLRCGAFLQCAVWDPGYEGRSEALLIVRNEHGVTFKKGAKIGQMIFIRLAEDATSVYEGRYKGENK